MKSESKTYRFIISGGGTGGHVFPAIAIANELKEKYKGCEILFVGAKGKMEMEKVPFAGYKIEGLWIGGFQRKNLLKNLSLPFKIISSAVRSRKIIKSFCPDMAIGTGGYASFSLLRAAAKMKVPIIIQEQNSFPGITNRYLAKYAEKICVAYEGMDKFFSKNKLTLTGNPVRKEIRLNSSNKDLYYKEFGLINSKPTLLVIGGSLGARTINEGIAVGIHQLLSKEIQVIWQTGKFYYEEMKQRLSDITSNKSLWMESFINNIGEAYAIADLIVGRAGAISLSELAIVGKPAILVPSPNVAEDHQTKNAEAMISKDAAVMIKDSEAIKKLSGKIFELINNKERLVELGNNISGLSLPDSSKCIVNEVDKVLKIKN